MSEARRPPLETKEIGIKRLVDAYQKNTGEKVPAKFVRDLEKKFEKEILPRTYEK